MYTRANREMLRKPDDLSRAAASVNASVAIDNDDKKGRRFRTAGFGKALLRIDR